MWFRGLRRLLARFMSNPDATEALDRETFEKACSPWA